MTISTIRGIGVFGGFSIAIRIRNKFPTCAVSWKNKSLQHEEFYDYFGNSLVMPKTETNSNIGVQTTLHGVVISPELVELSEIIWTATRDFKQRKFNDPLKYRYGLTLQINRNLFHVFLLILLAADVATNPGPSSCKKNIRCLSFNARGLCSFNNLSDGMLVSNLMSFQNLVYGVNLDLIAVTETWLKDNISDNEMLPYGYNVIRKGVVSDKRGGGVLLAIRDSLKYNRITSRNWSDDWEIIAVELTDNTSKKTLLSVCYRPPNCNLAEWFDLLTSFLQVTENYEKVIITGDFNFADLTWGSTITSNIISAKLYSTEFRELIYDFFLQQINIYPTRLGNILDLILTNCPEKVSNVSCVPAIRMNLFSDHNLLFYDIDLHIQDHHLAILVLFFIMD